MVQWFQKPETPPPPVLDEDYLARLGQHIGLAQVRELLADGLIELTDRLDRLREHAARGEVREIDAICHDIAGSAGHLGLSELSHAAVEACRICRQDPPPPADEIIAGVDTARTDALEAASRFCRAATEDATAGPE